MKIEQTIPPPAVPKAVFLAEKGTKNPFLKRALRDYRRKVGQLKAVKVITVAMLALAGTVAVAQLRVDFTEDTTGSAFKTFTISKASNGDTYFFNEVPIFEVTYKLPLNLPDVAFGHGGLWGLEISGMELETTKEMFGYEAFFKFRVVGFLQGKIGWGPLMDRDGAMKYPMRAEVVVRF